MTLSDSLENIAQTNVYGMFMSPIGVFHNTNHEQNKVDILEYVKTLDGESVTAPAPTSKISHNILQLGPPNLLDLPGLASVKESILQAVTEVNKQAFAYAIQQPTIVDSQLEVANEGSFLAPHEYANTVYRGYYYVNFDPQLHSSLTFKRNVASPHYPIIQTPNLTETPFNILEQQVPTQEGDIVIFPSNMTHGFENNTHANRMTISFNVLPF